MKTKTRKIIKIIGIDEKGKNQTCPNLEEVIEKSPILLGSERLLEFFPGFKGKKLVIKNTEKNKLSEMVEILKNENQDAIALASGDPLFFGIGSYLVSRLSETDFCVEIYPSPSSMQMAFARAGISWQEARCISLHGRKIDGLAQRIASEKKIAILTDRENHPGKIAEYLVNFNFLNYRAFVAENLGMVNEKTAWYALERLAQKNANDFQDLNVMLLVDDTGEATRSFGMGIPDEEFSYPEKPDGLITKKEIRILSLAAMNLHLTSVVWDIGSCSGSIAIEAARISREGRVYAIEKNPDHLKCCRRNMVKFQTDICIQEKEAPEGLSDLSDPDAVFIGGSGGRLAEILDVCCRKLRPGGRIVVNAATIETMQAATMYFKQNGFTVETCLGQISRSKQVARSTRFEALNPVFILTGYRDNDS